MPGPFFNWLRASLRQSLNQLKKGPSDDIEAGRHKPPFLMQELTEFPVSSCKTVCAGKVSRCIAVTGLVTQQQAPAELAIAYYCVPIDVSQYAFQWPGMEVNKLSSSQGFPALPGVLVSLHFATSWAPEFGIRDSLLAVVNVHDENYVNNPSTEMLEQVTNIFLYSSYKTVPLLILRTSVRTERQLAMDVPLPAAGGFLHKIEHVQVDTSDRRDGVTVLQVHGVTMQKQRIQSSDEFMWNIPQKACVRCSIWFSEDESIRVECEKSCENTIKITSKITIKLWALK